MKKDKEKNISLFELLDFSEENFSNFNISDSSRSYLYKNSLNLSTIPKKLFYEQNDKGETFIEVLTKLPASQSFKETHLRNFLLNSFFRNCLESKALDIDLSASTNSVKKKDDLLGGQISAFIESCYDKVCQIHNNGIKPNLNNFAQQINSIIKNSTSVNNETEGIKPVVEEFFRVFPATYTFNGSSAPVELIGSYALYDKVNNMDELKDKPYKAANFLRIYMDTLPDDYLCNELKTFMVHFGSNYFMFKLDRLAPLQDTEKFNNEFYQNILGELVILPVLNEIIVNTLAANKIIKNYETLDANMVKNDEPNKPKKIKI